MASNKNETYRFIYQEWDIMRPRQLPPEEKLEKLPPISCRQVSFGMQLQEARIKHRLTIHELAARCGLPALTLSLFENGTEVPAPEVAQKIHEVLDMV